MLDIRDVFSNLLGLFLLIGVGYGAVRFGILPAPTSKLFTRLLMNITLPATVLTSLVQPYDPSFLSSGLLIVALGTFFYLLYGAICALLVRPLRVPEGKRGVWILACTFSNNGFMGFPISLALFGEEGLVLAVFLGIPFNLLAYTLGPKLVCMDRAAAGNVPPLSWRFLLLTPVNVTTLLGLLLYGVQISIPGVLDAPLTYLSNVTTPLSMLIIGMNLTGGKLSSLLRDRDVFPPPFSGCSCSRCSPGGCCGSCPWTPRWWWVCWSSLWPCRPPQSPPSWRRPMTPTPSLPQSWCFSPACCVWPPSR